MNTRLQVEHPVTELVTGRDLVERPAPDRRGRAARRSPGAVDAASPGGHAVEVRLYAEDAEDGFLPATGRVERLRWPTGDGHPRRCRDRRGRPRSAPRFDPMLAKIIAAGGPREGARPPDAALDETVVLGLTTNLRFLRWLVREPAVRDGQIRIDTLERIWPPDDWAERARDPGCGLAGRRPRRWHGARRPAAGGSTGRPRSGSTRGDERTSSGRPRRRRSDAAATRSASVVRAGDVAHVDVAGRSVAVPARAPARRRSSGARGRGAHAGRRAASRRADAGPVLAVHVEVGDTVDAGDPIVTLEAMKMEHAVVAPIAGPGDRAARRGPATRSPAAALAVVEP